MPTSHIHLCNPKTPFNVGGAIRAAAIFGAERVTWDGERVLDERLAGATNIKGAKWRLPREERMKAYDVEWLVDEHAILTAVERRLTPVCVEIVPGAEPLAMFEHPERALYVFGPEDGGVRRSAREACHRFVRIPGKHCLNLAAAVNVILCHREIQRSLHVNAAEQDALLEAMHG